VCFALVDDDQKQKAIEGSGEMEANQQRSYGRSSVQIARTRPKLDCAWGPESDERWNIAQRPLKGIQAPPDADLVYAFCPKLVRAMSRPCIIARPVGSCYARYGVQLCPVEYQPHRLVSECIATKACTSFWFKGAFLASPKPTGRMTLLLGGSMHIFLCRQSFIGYVSPTAHPPPFSWRGKTYL
jgi:hypothetical protein